MDSKKILEVKRKIKKLITGEFKDDLKEATTTGCVAGFQTPYAFSPRKKSIGNKRAATVATGYTIAKNDESAVDERLISEETEYNLKTDFDRFMTKLKNADFAVENEMQTILNKQLKGRKVVLHGSKGYKQFKKDYEVDVVSVKVEDYYGNFEVVATGSDGKEYFIDRNFKVKILGGAAPAVQKQEQPVQQEPPKQEPNQTQQKQPEQPTAPAGNIPKTTLDKELKK